MEERENGMRIAVLGDRESTVGFAALGYTVCEAADIAAAERVLLSLVADPRYALIFLTEEYAAALTSVTDRYRDRAIPAIVMGASRTLWWLGASMTGPDAGRFSLPCISRLL